MIVLGKTYTDKITGIKGVATARTEYLNGCVRIMLECKASKDFKEAPEFWFDIDRLVTIRKKINGGPGAVPPARQAPKW